MGSADEEDDLRDTDWIHYIQARVLKEKQNKAVLFPVEQSNRLVTIQAY